MITHSFPSFRDCFYQLLVSPTPINNCSFVNLEVQGTFNSLLQHHVPVSSCSLFLTFDRSYSSGETFYESLPHFERHFLMLKGAFFFCKCLFRLSDSTFMSAVLLPPDIWKQVTFVNFSSCSHISTFCPRRHINKISTIYKQIFKIDSFIVKRFCYSKFYN